MNSSSPILATGYTPGLYAQCHCLTGPVWSQWAKLHAYDFHPSPWPTTNRRGALLAKLPVIASHLEPGRPCLWADVDALVVLASPDPAAELPDDVHLAAIVLPAGRPRTGHVLTGLLYATPAALPILRHAIRIQASSQSPYVEQRALAAALAGELTIPPIEPAPRPDLPVHALSAAWCRGPASHLHPSDPAYLWHASSAPHKRLAFLSTWLDQRRHLHPAGTPLPPSWCLPTLPTPAR